MKIRILVLIIFQFLAITALSLGEIPQKIRDFKLIAKEVNWELLPGVQTNARTYNGQVPGPEIRVKQGDRVRIVLENQLTVPTTSRNF